MSLKDQFKIGKMTQPRIEPTAFEGDSQMITRLTLGEASFVLKTHIKLKYYRFTSFVNN